MADKFKKNPNEIRPQDKVAAAPIRKPGQKGVGLGTEGPSKNPLSEKIKDFSLALIPRGSVLLKIVEKENVFNDGSIIIPDTVDKEQFGGMYYEVFKTGNADFAKSHPDYDDSANLTQKGNIVISLKPNMSKVFTHKGSEYLLVSENLIEFQVHPDNFHGFNM